MHIYHGYLIVKYDVFEQVYDRLQFDRVQLQRNLGLENKNHIFIDYKCIENIPGTRNT
jgi:hypothetical protein